MCILGMAVKKLQRSEEADSLLGVYAVRDVLLVRSCHSGVLRSGVDHAASGAGALSLTV